MSSSDDSVVATELNRYIKVHGRKDDVSRCWKIDAATEGWGKFLETFPQFNGRKPKKLCESNSSLLCWISDNSAPGKGYITVPFKQGMTPTSSDSVAVTNVKSFGDKIQTVLRAMTDVTVTTDVKNKTTQLIGKTPSTPKIVEVVTTVRPDFDLLFVIDVSGSMAGEESKQTYQAVSSIHGIIEDGDGMGIIKFSNTAERILSLTKKRSIAFPASIAPHLTTDGKQFQCGGGTKLWDSVALGMNTLMRRTQGCSHPKPSHPHLVVITDGEDNQSTEYTKDSIMNILQTPGDYAKKNDKDGRTFSNFHATLISVGSNHSTQFKTFAEIVKGKSHLHHLHADGAAEIANCFREVKHKILMLKETHVEVEVKAKTVETFKKISSGILSTSSSSSAPTTKKVPVGPMKRGG
eukprot:gene35040-45361_t